MNNGILLLMLLFFVKNKSKYSLLPITSNNIMNIDVKHTVEKIRLIKKIGPHLPEEYLPSINKAIMITERFIKLYEALELIQTKEADYIVKSTPIDNNQERLSYIANTIQREFSEDEIKKLGKTVDMILKLDKYHKMMNMLNTVMANPEGLNDKNNLIKLMEPLMKGKDEKEIKKLKDMYKMIDILKAIDSPKKSKEDGKKEENK